MADEVIPIPEGWVARSSSLPLVWNLNHVGVTADLGVTDAIALADQYLDGLPHRHLIVENLAMGPRLESELPPRGWKADRNVYMELRRAPDRGADTSGVIEVAEDAALELMARWNGEELNASAEEHRQVREATRLTWRARRARRFGVLGRDGALAGITMLFSDGEVAQVEDVYVVPEERGRGIGRALVTHAAGLARELGHELTFIAGDDKDWPKQLYAKVGFEAVGRSWLFHR